MISETLRLPATIDNNNDGTIIMIIRSSPAEIINHNYDASVNGVRHKHTVAQMTDDLQ